MIEKEYKYDIAFSFLKDDEEIAMKLNDLLQDRFSTFIYSKKQGEVAGTDGEKTFNEVFGVVSRLVVVLYRKSWGGTPWTRIEETAIRNRAYEHGYDFVKFIPLDEPPTVPEWLPRSQIWIGLKRWGLPGAASVIEDRVSELGGITREESVQDRAARLERSIKFKEKRNKFLNSKEGVNSANGEFEKLHFELEALVEIINKTASSVTLTTKYEDRHIVILGLSGGLSVYWHYSRYTNTLDESYLDVSIYNHHPPFSRIIHFEEPKRLKNKRYNIDISEAGGFSWVECDSEKRSCSTKDLASQILKYYMDHSEKNKLWGHNT